MMLRIVICHMLPLRNSWTNHSWRRTIWIYRLTALAPTKIYTVNLISTAIHRRPVQRPQRPRRARVHGQSY
jgi:hypothetical protein